MSHSRSFILREAPRLHYPVQVVIAAYHGLHMVAAQPGEVSAHPGDIAIVQSRSGNRVTGIPLPVPEFIPESDTTAFGLIGL